ncbi:MAG: 4-deoxy-4-formamido-L-arabinose-phosphoundecaprenol deformylase [Burkholderiales bacterium]
MYIALKVDAATLCGVQVGVPRILKLLEKHAAQATFFFSLGPDRSGRCIEQTYHRRFAKSLDGASLSSECGRPALLYGSVWPAPDIGRPTMGLLRAVKQAGYECALHAPDPVRWHNHAARADRAWTVRQLRTAYHRYLQIFDEAPKAFSAAHWRTNVHALRELQDLAFDYASDCRGTHPFTPSVKAEIIGCPQLPTTLPTLDELSVATQRPTRESVVAALLRHTEQPIAHVYTLRAELEGVLLPNVLDNVLAGWCSQGYKFVNLRRHYSELAKPQFPCHELILDTSARQGPAFPGPVPLTWPAEGPLSPLSNPATGIRLPGRPVL